MYVCVCVHVRCRSNPRVRVERGGTTRVSDEEERDAKKPTPDTYQGQPNMRERERERENTHAAPTLMYKKQRRGVMHPTPSETPLCTNRHEYIYILRGRYNPGFEPGYTQKKKKNLTLAELCRHGCGAQLLKKEKEKTTKKLLTLENS